MLSGIFGSKPVTPPPASPAKTAPPKPRPKDIFEACEKGDLEAVKAFHESGVDLNKANDSGWLPIHRASRNGKTEVVQHLIDNGSPVNQLTKKTSSFSPLYLACYSKNNETVKCLLQNGASPNQLIYDGLTTPLHTLNKKEDEPCARLLIQHGALVGCKDALGRTPLHYAQNLEIANLLINKGSPSYALDNAGNTPLQTTLASNQHFSAARIKRDQENMVQWPTIQVKERNEKGKSIKNSEKLYLFDNQTSDLYSIEESTTRFRGKALAVVAAAIPLAIKEVLANLIQTVSDAALAIWKSMKAFSKSEWATSLKNLGISIVWDAPAAVLHRIYRAIRAPLLAMAMFFAGFYALIHPLEGRATLNKIEDKWEETGLLKWTGLKKIGNVATTEINGYARYLVKDWEPEVIKA